MNLQTLLFFLTVRLLSLHHWGLLLMQLYWFIFPHFLSVPQYGSFLSVLFSLSPSHFISLYNRASLLFFKALCRTVGLLLFIYSIDMTVYLCSGYICVSFITLWVFLSSSQIWSKAGCTGLTQSCTCSAVSIWMETTGRRCSSPRNTWPIRLLSQCSRYNLLASSGQQLNYHLVATCWHLHFCNLHNGKVKYFRKKSFCNWKNLVNFLL